jgi:hypothetical protein
MLDLCKVGRYHTTTELQHTCILHHNRWICMPSSLTSFALALATLARVWECDIHREITPSFWSFQVKSKEISKKTQSKQKYSSFVCYHDSRPCSLSLHFISHTISSWGYNPIQQTVVECLPWSMSDLCRRLRLLSHHIHSFIHSFTYRLAIDQDVRCQSQGYRDMSLSIRSPPWIDPW